MRIHLTSFAAPDAVEFSTSCGRGAGRWTSFAHPPVVGQEYDVEFELPDERGLLDGSPSYALFPNGGNVVFNGLLESRDSDGLAYFRMGPGCLIMLGGVDRERDIGSWIRFSVPAAQVILFAQGG